MTAPAWLEDVSRETLEKLHVFEVLVRKWNPSINLVAKSTLSDFSNRHILDGLEVARAAPRSGSWIDLGSGGGFPGLVVSIIGGSDREMTLVESDGRKCAFLSTVRRELDLNCKVLNARIEDVEPHRFEVVSARALASLPKLIGLSHRFGDAESTFIFPKGENWELENVAARKLWRYDLTVLQNASSVGSVILKIKNIERVQA